MAMHSLGAIVRKGSFVLAHVIAVLLAVSGSVARAGEPGIVPMPLSEALIALRNSGQISSDDFNVQAKRLEVAYDELLNYRREVGFSSGRKSSYVTVMRNLGHRYGELLEERETLLGKLRPAAGAASSQSPYRSGAGSDAEKLDQVREELRSTLEKALLLPFVFEPSQPTDAMRRAASKSNVKVFLAMIGTLAGGFVTAAAADNFLFGHGVMASASWVVATTVFWRLISLRGSVLHEKLYATREQRAMAQAFIGERNSLLEEFSKSAAAVSETAKEISTESASALDFVTREIGDGALGSPDSAARFRMRVCEYAALTPGQRARVAGK